MKAELFFIPMPEIGHLVSMVELAKQIINLNDHFNITILTPTTAFATIAPPTCMTSTNLHFINLPQIDSPALHSVSGVAYYPLLAQLLKPHVKHAITNLMDPNSPQLSGLVFDMCFTAMIDVANELGVASYVYFPSSGAMLGLMLHLPTLHAQELVTQSKDLPIPSFVNLVPLQVLPSFMMGKDQEGYKNTLDQAKIYKETKGIIVNTSTELEPGILDLFSYKEYPPIYPVGPLLDLHGDTKSLPDRSHYDFIMRWLDDQPPASVIYLCFGSRGAFGVSQVHEIANGLELSSHRFLWSLRQPPIANHDPPSDYVNPKDVLPDGFLDRTADRGLVCGWAPQVLVLAHKAIGGFVSHCGWNSILESLWYGVPILAWPIHAEQKLNAHRLAKELGLAVMVKQNYMEGTDLFGAYTDGGDLLIKDEVERGVDRVMDGDSEVRRKVKDIKEKFRKAMMDNGSSFGWMKTLVENMLVKN